MPSEKPGEARRSDPSLSLIDTALHDDQVTKLLKDSGFVPSRIRHFNLRDNAPALVSSLFPSLDPVSRTVRQRKHDIHESTPLAWSRHAIYLFFVICAYPIALLESAVGRGATVMIEARRK